MRCDVILVNWNAGEQLTDCLASLADSEGVSFSNSRVVVVDNASTDGSADAAEAAMGGRLPLTVIRNAANRGFGAACNQGAMGSSADCLLFLNPDMRLERTTLADALSFLSQKENAAVGVCGIALCDADGTIHRTCARKPLPRHFAAKMLGLDRIAPGKFPSHMMDEWDHADTRDVDHVMGAFYLIRRPVFEAIQGFDERFFVYLEDLDLSVRVKEAGRRIVHFAGTRAYHRGGGTSESVKATRLFYSLRSRIQYGFKHFGPLPATLLLLGTLLMEPPIRLLLAASRRSPTEAWDTLRGTARLWIGLPRLRVSR